MYCCIFDFLGLFYIYKVLCFEMYFEFLIVILLLIDFGKILIFVSSINLGIKLINCFY